VTNTEYVEHFKALVGVVEMYKGAYGKEDWWRRSLLLRE